PGLADDGLHTQECIADAACRTDHRRGGTGRQGSRLTRLDCGLSAIPGGEKIRLRPSSEAALRAAPHDSSAAWPSITDPKSAAHPFWYSSLHPIFMTRRRDVLAIHQKRVAEN